MLRRLLKLEAQNLAELRKLVREAVRDVNEINVSNKDRFVSKVEKLSTQLDDEIAVAVNAARQLAAEFAYDEYEEEEVEYDPEDDARSGAVAASFAAAWLFAMLSVGPKGQARLTETLDVRLRRIAATEVFQAYSQAVLRIAPTRKEMLKRWNATLDLKTCATCSSLHGVTIPVNQEFKYGYEPGDVHPRCRCVLELLDVPTD
jgi:Phage Mu protein F like protein